MRKRFLEGTAETVIGLAILGLAGWTWRDASGRQQAAIGALAVAMLAARYLTYRARRATKAQAAAAILAEETAAAERATIAANRARALRARAATATEAVNAAIVEIVATQQALVRQAHPDDILVRMRAAEDAAYSSLDDIRRIADDDEDPAPTTSPPRAPLSVDHEVNRTFDGVSAR
jgi:hypothetical protein